MNANINARRQHIFGQLEAALAKVNAEDLKPQTFAAPTHEQLAMRLKDAWHVARPVILLVGALPGFGDKLHLITQLLVEAADGFSAQKAEADVAAPDSTSPDFKAGKDL